MPTGRGKIFAAPCHLFCYLVVSILRNKNTVDILLLKKYFPDMANVIEYNQDRLKYLLELYKLYIPEFLRLINSGLRKPLTKENIFSSNIKIDNLKRIDKVFNKGLSYYLDPQNPPQTKDASIFFRKKNFNSELNFGAKKIVSEFEDLKLSISAIAKLSDIEIKRTLPILSTRQNAKATSKKFIEILNPSFINSQKDFLTSLINKLAAYNILVLEFVENWNQKEKANIDGVFLTPNVIVLKRQWILIMAEKYLH